MDDDEVGWHRHAPAYSHFNVSSGAQQLRWLLEIYNAPVGSPFDACLDVLDGVRTVVVEHEYYDPDYRSDYSEFHSRSFEQLPHHTDRLHFFRAEFDRESVYALTADAVESYLGYVVVRPGSAAGTVGRAMLFPPSKVVDGTTTSVASLVRTAVKERVLLFGQPLEVVGVPFMQQDSRSLRCAHVAAWTCHYTAALRGFVPRRLTSHLHDAAQSGGTVRPFPSQGLSESQLAELLRYLGLPAHLQAIQPLSDRWDPKLDDQVSHTVWHRGSNAGKGNRSEALRTYCARYLNSGLPVLITISDDGAPRHVVTVVGQGRVDRSSRAVFVFHDDEVGPYQTREEPVDDGKKVRWSSVFVPLPEKVWMLGEHAERAAEESMHVLASSTELQSTGMADFKKQVDAGALGVRSYVMLASEFKQSIRDRLGPERSQEAAVIGQARMSRFVWVIEVFDRELRNSGDPNHVLGEVVIDSTAADPREGVLVEHFGGVLKITESVFVPFAERFTLYEQVWARNDADSAADEDADELSRAVKETTSQYLAEHLARRRQAVEVLTCPVALYSSGKRSLDAATRDVASAPSNGFSIR